MKDDSPFAGFGEATDRLYVPPADGEPLNEIQLALVRALVPILVRKILEDSATGDRNAPAEPPPDRAMPIVQTPSRSA